MASKWRRCTIGDLCDAGVAVVQTGPFGSQLHAYDYVDDGIPVVPTEAIRDRQIDHSVLPKISADKADELSRHRLKPGDILFARRGVQATGHIGCVRHTEDGFICGTGAILLRVDESRDQVRADFLSHVLANPASVEWFKFHAIGATMPNLNEGIIRSFPLSLPPLTEQSAIARVLSALDDKIELNRSMIETLEGIAQALFKSWFVDFDPVRAKAEGRDPKLPNSTAALFPESFDDSELGEIPTGWATSPIYDIATFINGAAYRDFEPNQERRGLPIVKIAELKAGVTIQTGFSLVEMPEKYRINTRDILFSWSGNPDTSIDTFVWTHGPAWLNQHIFRVVPPTEDARAFVLMTLRYLRPVFAETARNKQTTGLGHVTSADLRRLLVTRPPRPVLLRWKSLVEPLLERSFNLQIECSTLVVLRDALLPKLISGELRVKDAERQLEAAL